LKSSQCIPREIHRDRLRFQTPVPKRLKNLRNADRQTGALWVVGVFPIGTIHRVHRSELSVVEITDILCKPLRPQLDITVRLAGNCSREQFLECRRRW
jgi:hypothetical protein